MKSTQTLPTLNLDNFDPAVMYTIWKEYGTFIIEGKAVDALRKTAVKAMAHSKKMFDLPIENLQKADHKGTFNGFQDVEGNTTKRVKDGANIPIRKQLAYTLKPDLMPQRSVPEGLGNVDIFDEYYAQAKKTILHPLYNLIADAFIKKEFRSDLSQDMGSTFATRMYCPKRSSVDTEEFQENENVKKAKKTSLPGHTDFGNFTIVTTDGLGLEALTTSGEWIAAPADPDNLIFIINIGDWALFQAYQSGYTEFKEGIHRVIEAEKCSLIVEFLPPYAEKILTPKGVVVDFETFLKGGNKAKYRDTSRDECADTVAESIARLRPVKPITEFAETPTLYVIETGKQGQEPWVMVSGKDKKLCPSDVTDVPEKAHDYFSFGYINTDNEKSDTFARTFEVKLNCANDVYVVDEYAEYDQAIAKTLVPLAEYKNNYKNPVYLINRPLLIEEARDITPQKSNLLQFSQFGGKQNLSERKDDSYTPSVNFGNS